MTISMEEVAKLAGHTRLTERQQYVREVLSSPDYNTETLKLLASLTTITDKLLDRVTRLETDLRDTNAIIVHWRERSARLEKIVDRLREFNPDIGGV